MTDPQSPDLIVPRATMNLALGVLRWMNADDGVEASLTMDEIPGQDWDGIILLVSDFLEKARRRRTSYQARTEGAPRPRRQISDDYKLSAAVETMMNMP
jgi:hypothetical protein